MATNGKDNAEEVVENVSEAVEEVKKKMNDFDINETRREAMALAEEVRKEASKKLNAAAERIRTEVREQQLEGDGLEKADEIAAHLEKTAHYLGDRTLEEMGEDATRVVVENPWQAVLIAMIVGVVMGLLLRRR